MFGHVWTRGAQSPTERFSIICRLNSESRDPRFVGRLSDGSIVCFAREPIPGRKREVVRVSLEGRLLEANMLYPAQMARTLPKFLSWVSGPNGELGFRRESLITHLFWRDLYSFLTLEQILRHAQELALGLHHLHTSLHHMHGDVTPANIGFRRETGVWRAVLFDLEMAHLSGMRPFGVCPTKIVCTAQYATPEQICSKPQTEATDLLGLVHTILGVILKRHCFEAETIDELASMCRDLVYMFHWDEVEEALGCKEASDCLRSVAHVRPENRAFQQAWPFAVALSRLRRSLPAHVLAHCIP